MKPSLQEVFKTNQNQLKAIPGFNFDSLEIAKGIAAAASELQYPVLLMVTESAAKSMGIDSAIAIIKSLTIKNPYLYSHWDHGFSFDLAMQAVDHQLDCVMYDGSRINVADNIINSQKFVAHAHKNHVMTECEIGKIGGKEDEHISDDEEYTPVEVAVDFHKKVQCDLLAVALGTAHGFYQKPVQISFTNIQKISQQIYPQHLVLHGCTGVDFADITQAINLGIKKLNFGTVLKKVSLDCMRNYLNNHPQASDLKAMHQLVVETVKEEAKKIIRICMND